MYSERRTGAFIVIFARFCRRAVLNAGGFGYYDCPICHRRRNTHYDSSREKNSGNVRTAVRQRLNPPRPHAGAYPG